MHLGMIGAKRMGASLARRLTQAEHEYLVGDANPATVKKIAGSGIRGFVSILDMVAKLPKPCPVWLMAAAGMAGKGGGKLASQASPMDAGDIVSDGGNSYHHDDLPRAKALKLGGIHSVDRGTRGGVFGLERGYCPMIGAVLFERFSSRGDADFANRVLPVMQRPFGGHNETKPA